MNQNWAKKPVVVAIDFGSAYSGYSYSLLKDYSTNPDSQLTHTWTSCDNQSTTKTPTCLLLNSDKTFLAFGYDAESQYTDIVSECDLIGKIEDARNFKEFHYFEKFKMELYNKENFFNRLVIKDAEGRTFSAVDMFGHAIRFLKNHLLSTLKEAHPALFKEEEIFYVLTVPAIWSEVAKQFMRNAAELAGIESDHLKIALEPECAALLCKRIVNSDEEQSKSTSGDNGKKKTTPSPLCPGSVYMVLDMGGGTLDVTVHEVQKDWGLCEVHSPFGGPWGGESINQAFRNFIKSLIGAKVYMAFYDKYRMDFLTLMRGFEAKKCSQQGETVYISFPPSLADLYKKEHGVDFTQSTTDSVYANVLMTQGRFRMKKETFEGFFQQTVDETLRTIESVMKSASKPIDTFLLVGGLSNCRIIKSAIENRFPDQRLINPKQPSEAVMKGAIIFGRQPEIISNRICRHTYGIDWNEPFDSTVHSRTKKEVTGYCRDIFKVLATRDSLIPYNFVVEIETGVKSSEQNRIDFPFYMSDDYCPKYVDDASCKHIGTLSVSLPSGKSFLDQSVFLHVAIGGSEIEAEAVDATGGKHRVRFNIDIKY